MLTSKCTRWMLCASAATAATSCNTTSPEELETGPPGQTSCSIPQTEIFNGGPGRDGIPALTNPDFVPVGSSRAAYLDDFDRVIGLVIQDLVPAPSAGETLARAQPRILAIPLNILWWHEIVNLQVGLTSLAVTHCPLTGSSLAFDRSSVGGAEFGVSGLLFKNNLMMFDRQAGESLWPQMARAARCGVKDGQTLEMYPIIEMRWGDWRRLYPFTEVISDATGFDRNYQLYPYGDYDRLSNEQLLFPQGPLDERREPKERVLGIPDGEGGISFPFGELDELGEAAVVPIEQAGREMVVFFDRSAQGAMVYQPVLDGDVLTFRAEGDRILDEQTNSVWTVDGLAVEGPLARRRLTAIPEAYVAYWFAWAAFHPDTELWSPS